MHDSALFEAIQSLNAWEARRFRVRLQSPFFNHKSTLLRLFDYLWNCRSSNGQPDQTGALTVLDIHEDGSVARLRYEMSELLALLRDYLTEVELEKVPWQRHIALVRALRKRGLEKNFRHVVRESPKIFTHQDASSSDRRFMDFQLQTELYEWEIRSRRYLDFPFHQQAEHLNTWYAGQLLQMACSEVAQAALQRQDNAHHQLADWVESVLASLPNAPHLHDPATMLYHCGLQMLKDSENSALAERFRELLELQIELLAHSEARELLLLAINHGIRRINAGERQALRRTLDFYLLGLRQKLLLDENGLLSKFTYNNVLMTFLALEEWAQALEFLEQYRLQLPLKEQDNIFRYNMAVYRFRKGDFNLALELLRNVNFPDPLYNLESRKMLLKIYYEQHAFDALESLLENLLTWLRRHNEIGYQREMYRNLARFTGQLLRLTPDDRDAARRLAHKIRETTMLAERSWLLEKLEGR
jgi:hypothetical protein